MPITVFHGEDLKSSRRAFGLYLDEQKLQGWSLNRIEIKTLTPEQLSDTIGQQDLFDTSKTVYILEELHSLPTSKRKTALLNLLAESPHQFVLWEKRTLTKTMLKKLAATTVNHFPLSKLLFKWVATISPKGHDHALFKQVLEREDAYLCFIMAARQVRMLIQAADGGSIAGPPFMQQAISSQARKFTFAQLLELHSKLVELDIAHKTGLSHLDLEQELDILLRTG